jgi:hypothetical protein
LPQQEAPVVVPYEEQNTTQPYAEESEEDDDWFCLAGDSMVMLRERGPTPLANVVPGESVLVETINKDLHYEPLLGFIHAVTNPQGKSGMAGVTLVHAKGELQLSANHLVLAVGEAGQGLRSKVAKAIVPGDWLHGADGSPVQIAAVYGTTVTSGMFAPLTASGTIIAGGLRVSSYAQPGDLVTLTHAAAHAAMFPVRAFYKLGFYPLGSKDPEAASGNKMHPFAEFLLGALRMVVRMS